VAVVPGTAFGAHGPRQGQLRHVQEKIREGMARFASFMGALR
jgi:aspartate/methionine/tyrosine aminotransferase